MKNPYKRKIDFKKIAFRILTPILAFSIMLVEVILINKFPHNALLFGILGLVLFVLLFAGLVVLGVYLGKKARSSTQIRIEDIVYDKINVNDEPCLMCTQDGRILWANKFVRKTLNQERVVGLNAQKLFKYTLLENRQPKEKYPDFAEFDGEKYFVEEATINYGNEVNVLLTFRNVTELIGLRTFVKNKEKVVAYVIIDNIDELLRFEQDRYREISAKIESILRNWCDSVNGFLREYEKDKYIFIFNSENLDTFVEAKFNVLDKVREIKVGKSNIPVTLSMGVALVDGTMGEKERVAQQALDMALQRGGDQAAVKIGEKVSFYGGLVNSIQNRIKVRSRVIANELVNRINNAGNVLVMGHKSPDYDAIGASVGIARLAMMYKKKVNIVTDLKDSNVKRCFNHFAHYENLKGVFVDSSKAFNLVRTDTLLVIVDVNNVAMFESKDLARMVDDIIIIDHHRKTAEFEKKPVLDYIEPSASSASEIVAELLEQVVPVDFLTPTDADMLYSGIVLDTKNFTKGAGTKTYSAAMYLRDIGAQYERIQGLFKTNLDDYKKEIKFAERIDIYRNCFAIAINESGKDSQDRIMAAKIADNMLSLEGVAASFALVKIGNTVAISARSNGSVNVQLILEEMNGGGRYDAAGAQVTLSEKESTLQQVLNRLKQAIDNKVSLDD